MRDIARFLDIPVRDDASEFGSFARGSLTIDGLKAIGVDVAGRTVFDLGAGFGSMSIAAAKAGASRVVALDINQERLDAIRDRGVSEHLKIETRKFNLLNGEPLAKQADIALMIGVVEYAGLWSAIANPTDCQVDALRTAHSALKPKGRLVLATKNRAWPGFVVRDVHTGQPFVNALPRSFADKLSFRLSGTKYRHHLHTARQWRRLLKAAGFTTVESFVPYFSYQFPLKIVTRPSARDIPALRSILTDNRRESNLPTGRWPVLKAGIMVAAAYLRLPVSQSIILVATK